MMKKLLAVLLLIPSFAMAHKVSVLVHNQALSTKMKALSNEPIIVVLTGTGAWQGTCTDQLSPQQSNIICEADHKGFSFELDDNQIEFDGTMRFYSKKVSEENLLATSTYTMRRSSTNPSNPDWHWIKTPIEGLEIINPNVRFKKRPPEGVDRIVMHLVPNEE